MYNLIMETHAGKDTYDVLFSSAAIEIVEEMRDCFEEYVEYLDLKYENHRSMYLTKMLSNWKLKYTNKEVQEFVCEYFNDKWSSGIGYYFIIKQDKYSERN